MLAPLAYSGQTSLRNAGYGFDGVLHVYDISYAPEDGSAPVRIGQVDVETPGFWWVVRQALPDSKPSRSERLLDLVSGGGGDEPDWYYPATPRLVLHVREFDWGDYGLGAIVPAVDWVGPHSGALFEAEGCPKDNWWTADDLRGRMGLDPGEGNIRIVFEVTGEHNLRRRWIATCNRRNGCWPAKASRRPRKSSTPRRAMPPTGRSWSGAALCPAVAPSRTTPSSVWTPLSPAWRRR